MTLFYYKLTITISLLQADYKLVTHFLITHLLQHLLHVILVVGASKFLILLQIFKSIMFKLPSILVFLLRIIGIFFHVCNFYNPQLNISHVSKKYKLQEIRAKNWKGIFVKQNMLKKFGIMFARHAEKIQHVCQTCWKKSACFENICWKVLKIQHVLCQKKHTHDMAMNCQQS